MRSLGGFVLLAGIGFGLFVYLPAPVNSDTSLDQARRLAAARAAQARAIVASTAQGARSFAPDVSLAAIAHNRRQATAAQSAAPNGWPAGVSLAAANAQGQPTLTPSNPDSRYKLVVDIQRELKRVGCYYGRLNGSWGDASKYAVKDFMDRVNAALPIEQPDYVLLTLLQAQSGKTCGECPVGQMATAGGRCVPQANYAQTQQPGAWPTTTTAAATPAPDPLPWKASGSAQPLFKPVASSVISSEPLPGRMAIGGPRELPPVDSASTVIIDANGNPVPPADAAASTAALAPAAPPAATPSKSRPTKSARRREGPGTPRYNLLLSLGGVY
jgi:hypothetical protein